MNLVLWPRVQWGGTLWNSEYLYVLSVRWCNRLSFMKKLGNCKQRYPVVHRKFLQFFETYRS